MGKQLREAENKARGEYEGLQSGKHDLHKQLEETVKDLKSVIAERKQTLDELVESIAVNALETKNTEMRRDHTNQDYTAALTKLKAAKDKMETSLNNAKKEKEEAEESLAKKISDHETEVKELSESLVAT